MDKSEFLEKAPLYYALAIGLCFASGANAQTRHAIRDEYTLQSDPDDPDTQVCLVDVDVIWDRAIAWLTARGFIESLTDPFGPPIYVRNDTFGQRWHELSTTLAPFRNAAASEAARGWTISALSSVDREYRLLEISQQDFETPEREWEPIPLDENNPALQKAIDDLDKTIADVEQSNGYATQYPEERNFVLDNLRMLSQKMKSAGTISVSYIRTHGLSVLKKIQDRFVDTAIGEGAKETVRSILHWLHEIINYIIY
jgi:hypothetical protein